MIITVRRSIPFSKTASRSSAKVRARWVRRACMREVMRIRDKVLKETGEDIFQIQIFPDGFEFAVFGDLHTMKVEKE
jgi:hypothetical protein